MKIRPEILKELINTPSPSGFEEKVAQVWVKHISPYVDKIKKDFYGNHIAVINETGSPKIMLSGHIDEIGLAVRFINDEGFIYVAPIGGWDPSVLVGQRVTIHTKNDGDLSGVISRKPTHQMSEEEQEEGAKFRELYVDVGASSGEDLENMVFVGDPITIDRTYQELLNQRITGRGLDNRVGAFTILEVARQLYNEKVLGNLNAAVYYVASTQEENGIYGVIMSAYNVNPDVALAVDLTLCTDFPEAPKERFGDINLEKGPVVAVGPTINKKISNLLQKIATDENISIQHEVCSMWSGTDADNIFINRGGVATGLLSIACRNMHSSCEIVSLKDINQAVELIVKFCSSLDRDTFSSKLVLVDGPKEQEK